MDSLETLFTSTPNVFINLDDVLIARKEEHEHSSELENMLEIISENNLRHTPRKCQLLKTILTFIGYEVSTDEIRPPSDRVRAVSKF